MQISDDSLKLAANIVQAALGTAATSHALNNPEAVAKLFETIAVKAEELRSRLN